MANNSNLYNVEMELSYLAGLIEYPDLYVETEFLTPKDLSNEYGSILGIINNIIETGNTPTPVVIAEKCQAIGVRLDGIDILTFCKSLKNRSVDKKVVLGIAKEIKKKAAIRKILDNTRKLEKEVLANQNEPIKDIIGLADKYLGESLISLDDESVEPINFLEVLPDVIEEYGNDDGKFNVILTPYESFNNNFIGLRNNNLYILTARAGSAKSTFLLDMMRKVPEYNPDKPDLATIYLDTEMEPSDSMIRYVCASINVPYHLIDQKQWRRDPVWSVKIRAELDRIRKIKTKRTFFEKIGNKSGLELEKYIKRFYLNKVGRGNPLLILYDYLKLSNGDKAGNQQEYIAAYEKSQILKELAEYCACPIFTAIQANRSGIVNGKKSSDLEDNDAQNSMSDRLNWLAAFMGILRKRTHDEMITDSTPEQLAPTHKLIPTKTRYLGKSGPDFMNYVRVKDGKDIKFKQNFINFDINNFAVEDCGTYDQLLVRNGLLAQKNEGKKDGSLF